MFQSKKAQWTVYFIGVHNPFVDSTMESTNFTVPRYLTGFTTAFIFSFFNSVFFSFSMQSLLTNSYSFTALRSRWCGGEIHCSLQKSMSLLNYSNTWKLRRQKPHQPQLPQERQHMKRSRVELPLCCTSFTSIWYTPTLSDIL